MAAALGAQVRPAGIGAVNDWRDAAACRAAVERGEARLNDWVPEGRGANYKRARAVCAGCAVREPCLDEALVIEGLVLSDRIGMFGA
jgi:hypothetical protein